VRLGDELGSPWPKGTYKEFMLQSRGPEKGKLIKKKKNKQKKKKKKNIKKKRTTI